jgi:hypothetical protein
MDFWALFENGVKSNSVFLLGSLSYSVHIVQTLSVISGRGISTVLVLNVRVIRVRQNDNETRGVCVPFAGYIGNDMYTSSICRSS